jgi:hypothetical protein
VPGTTIVPAIAAADFPIKSRRFIPDESLMCALPREE